MAQPPTPALRRDYRTSFVMLPVLSRATMWVASIRGMPPYRRPAQIESLVGASVFTTTMDHAIGTLNGEFLLSRLQTITRLTWHQSDSSEYPYCNEYIYSGSMIQYRCGTAKHTPMAAESASSMPFVPASETAASSTTTNTAESTSDTDSEISDALKKIGISAGALVGICVAALALCCGGCCGFMVRKKRRYQKRNHAGPYIHQPVNLATYAQQPFIPHRQRIRTNKSSQNGMLHRDLEIRHQGWSRADAKSPDGQGYRAISQAEKQHRLESRKNQRCHEQPRSSLRR